MFKTALFMVKKNHRSSVHMLLQSSPFPVASLQHLTSFIAHWGLSCSLQLYDLNVVHFSFCSSHHYLPQLFSCSFLLTSFRIKSIFPKMSSSSIKLNLLTISAHLY